MVDLYVFKNKFANTPKFHDSPIDCTQIITICRVSVKVLGENNEFVSMKSENISLLSILRLPAVGQNRYITIPVLS